MKQLNLPASLREVSDPFMLIGLMNIFMNRYQILADRFFDELSWKQSFLLIVISSFDKPPMQSEVAELLGTSHQNVKQMLLRLQALDYVTLNPDPEDRRKQRIALTEKARDFQAAYAEPSAINLAEIFVDIPSDNLSIMVAGFQQMLANLIRMNEEEE